MAFFAKGVHLYPQIESHQSCHLGKDTLQVVCWPVMYTGGGCDSINDMRTVCGCANSENYNSEAKLNASIGNLETFLDSKRLEEHTS